VEVVMRRIVGLSVVLAAAVLLAASTYDTTTYKGGGGGSGLLETKVSAYVAGDGMWPALVAQSEQGFLFNLVLYVPDADTVISWDDEATRYKRATSAALVTVDVGDSLDVSILAATGVAFDDTLMLWSGKIEVKQRGTPLEAAVAAYSPGAEGGADSLMVAVTADYGYPTKTLVSTKIVKALGVLPTVEDVYAVVIDTTGQTYSAVQIDRAGTFSAKNDTVWVKAEVFLLDDTPVADDEITWVVDADYWRWWNYSWAACVTMDDAFLASLAQADSLFDANGLRFTSFYNPVWLLTRNEGAQQIADPTEFAAYHAYGNFDAGGHGLTHASLYNLKARGSTNDGGCVTAADTTAATNWNDFRAVWKGDFDTAGLQRYFAGSLTFSDPGISFDTGTTLFSLSGMTIGEHFYAEISRDSLEAFTGIPKADQKTFAYPHYTTNVFSVAALEAEGYIAARGSFDNTGSPWGDLTSAPRNTWGEISLYRVPLLHSAASVFGDHDGEENTKTRIRAAIGAKNPGYGGGLWPILTHSINPVDYPTQFTLPEELAWWFTCVADSGGIIVGFQEAAEYYRDRIVAAYLTSGGDRVYTTTGLPPVERAVIGHTLGTARTAGENASLWPAGWDVSSNNTLMSLLGPCSSTPDSAAHPNLPTTGPTLRFNTAYRANRVGTPLYLWLWSDILDVVPSDADTVFSAQYRFRMRDTGGHYQELTGADSVHVLVSHNIPDIGWVSAAAPGSYAFERNTSWLYMDADNTATVWEPSMNTRIFQRGLATWTSYDSMEFALNTWYSFDITTGIRKAIQDNAPFSGVLVIGVTPVAGNDQYFSWHGEQYVSAVRFPWWEIVYRPSRSPYWRP